MDLTPDHLTILRLLLRNDKKGTKTNAVAEQCQLPIDKVSMYLTKMQQFDLVISESYKDSREKWSTWWLTDTGYLRIK